MQPLQPFTQSYPIATPRFHIVVDVSASSYSQWDQLEKLAHKLRETATEVAWQEVSGQVESVTIEIRKDP